MGQLTEFNQLYNKSHTFKYPIEKLNINTPTNQEKYFNTILVTWTHFLNATIFYGQFNIIVFVNIAEDASMLYFLLTNN